MNAPILQQKCPYCDVMLSYTYTTASGPTEGGGTNVTVNAATTPESTAHVWTHAPKGDK